MNEFSEINRLTPACRITDAALQADPKTTILTSEPRFRIRSHMLQATPKSPPVEFKKIVIGLVIPRLCRDRKQYLSMSSSTPPDRQNEGFFSSPWAMILSILLVVPPPPGRTKKTRVLAPPGRFIQCF